MYETLEYVPDHDLEMTWSNYLYNGLNEETTGACSGEGLEIAREYAGYSRSSRQSYELQLIKERVKEKGWKGLIDFWLRKQVMNFNDGTFSWFQEGFFHAWDYEDITASRYKEPLRNFYWIEGSDYAKFTTWSQGIWIFVLLGIMFDAVSVIVQSVKGKEDSETLCLRTVEIVTFIGVFLFVMLFEGRARYLLNSTSVFVTMAVLGYCGVSWNVRDHVMKIAGKLRSH